MRDAKALAARQGRTLTSLIEEGLRERLSRAERGEPRRPVELHNLDVIKTADRIIDMGPEGGEEGGLVVAHGTPEQVAGTEGSYTGRFLADGIVEPKSRRPRRRLAAAA